MEKNLNNSQIKRILDVISTFGLNFYTDKLEPDYYELKNFLRRKI